MIKAPAQHIILRVSLITIMFITAYTKCFAQYSVDVIKAAYIERITRFVDWPTKDSLSIKNQFIIGVYDDDEILNTLIEIYKNKTIKGLPVKIIPVKSPEQIGKCNLIYLASSAKSILSEFIYRVNATGILLISGSPGFSKAGVHINFYEEEDKLKFEINELSMTSAGFKVSYLLLQNTRLTK